MTSRDDTALFSAPAAQHGGGEDVHLSAAHAEKEQEIGADYAKHYGPNGHTTYLGLSGVKLNLAIAICAGVGFVLFGYDQGVMGSLLTLVPFLERFPRMNGETDSAIQGATIGIYEIGCFLGSITCILWGNTFGRRKMIWFGSVYVMATHPVL